MDHFAYLKMKLLHKWTRCLPEFNNRGKAMSVMGRGFLSLLFWLIVGLGFTGMTVLALNAWVEHLPHGQLSDS